MKQPSVYLKMRVLGAVDTVDGRTRHERVHNVAAMTFLDEEGHSRQFTWRTIQTWHYRYKNHGISSHPDRDAQFTYLNEQVVRFQRRHQPAVSVDTKKKELVGDFKNGGREYRRRGRPQKVRVHDFKDEELGKAIPYGVYDLQNNEGWVSVGIGHDTAEFAANTIHSWWQRMGRKRFPNAKELLITADSGGSNSARSRLWKVALQKLADRTGLKLTICHFPPGTSKWNKIEHRLFSFITMNWRGKPLVSVEAIVELIGNTTTRTGLQVKTAIDSNSYEAGIVVSDDELAQVQLRRHEFHGDWNYSIAPR